MFVCFSGIEYGDMQLIAESYDILSVSSSLSLILETEREILIFPLLSLPSAARFV